MFATEFFILILASKMNYLICIFDRVKFRYPLMSKLGI